jgi:hypothetical protein
MDELPIFVAGLIVGLVLAAIAALVRGRSVADLGSAEPPGASLGSAGPGRPAPPPPTPGGERIPDSIAGPGPALLEDSPGTSIQTTPQGLHLTRRIVRRIGTRLEPGGQLTITVDGATYHHLEDIPDAATRDQVRATLDGLPAQVSDEAMREKVVGELHDAGIEPTES